MALDTFTRQLLLRNEQVLALLRDKSPNCRICGLKTYVYPSKPKDAFIYECMHPGRSHGKRWMMLLDEVPWDAVERILKESECSTSSPNNC